MRAKHPERIIELVVKKNRPKTRLGNRLIHKLKVYTGEEHPHGAQNPVALKYIILNKLLNGLQHIAVGKRKTSTARVILRNGNGKITINDREGNIVFRN